MSNHLKDLNMPSDRSPNGTMPQINSTSSFDDDTYWDNDYNDDVIDDQPPSIKDKPLPAIPDENRWPNPPEPVNEYLNMVDDRFKFKVKFDFDASTFGDGYLSVKTGDEVYSELSFSQGNGWLTVDHNGESGMVPFNYLTPC